MIEEASAQRKYEWIIIDEVQRLPKVLNHVHRMIEQHGQRFALTGSSARKLKRGAANLLAGRAFVNVLFPLTVQELGDSFSLPDSIRWGTLPKLLSLSTAEEKRAYLRSYCLTYVKEEIQAEQIVRRLEPFREFLTVAAQMSGKLINFSAIARDVGAHVPTIQTYYQILEDTHLGFFLPHFHRSVRKSQIATPKFYLFDNGVKNALEGALDSAPAASTSWFGDLFEAFVIQEFFRLNQYLQKDFRFSFYQTKAGTEIDLILSKGRKAVLVEIKSSERVDEVEAARLARIRPDFGSDAQAFYVTRDHEPRLIEGVHCLHWREALNEFSRL